MLSHEIFYGNSIGRTPIGQLLLIQSRDRYRGIECYCVMRETFLLVRFSSRHGVQQGMVGNRSAFATLKVIQFPLRQDVERFSIAPSKESP